MLVVFLQNDDGAEQNLDWANGRSQEIVSTIVFASLPASWSNRRADAAQTPVSRLGTLSPISDCYGPYLKSSK